MDNIILPAVKTDNVVDDSTNEYVEGFVSLCEKWKTNTIRIDKMNAVEEDYQILEDLNDRLPDTLSPNMKDSILFKLLRIFETEASDLPKIKPSGKMASESTLSLMDNLKDHILEKSYMADLWRDVLKGFVAEGAVIVQEGADKKGEIVPLEVCDLASVYFDPTMEEIADESSRRGKAAKTIIREVGVNYSEFKSLYPDFAGKVSRGAPITRENKAVYNISNYEHVKDDDKIYIHYAYSIENEDEPIMAVYAGGSSTLLELNKGKEYPFTRAVSGKPFLPFRLANFAPRSLRRGFYGASIIGMGKDGAKSYAKLLNVSLPVFSKMVNPMLLLLGDKTARDVEEMQIAAELQQLGVSQMIPVGGQGVQVQEVKPQSIANDFESFRTIILRDMSLRYDINLQALEQMEQTATETIAKNKVELKAILGLYKNNDKFFEGLIRDCLDIYVKYNDTRLPKKIKVKDSAGAEKETTLEIAFLEAEAWDGSFKMEADLKIPMSTQDKVNAQLELENFKRTAFYSVPFTSEAQIRAAVSAVYNLAYLRELDHIYSKEDLTAEASTIMVGQQAQTQANANTNTQEIAPENEEVAQELSPNKFLAEQVGL